MESASRPMYGRRRQKVSRMTVTCLIISGIALVLHFVSVVTNFWTTFSMRTYTGDMDVYAYTGLWKVSSCASGSCKWSGITIENVKLYHVVLVAAIPAILLTVLLDVIELFYESKAGWRIFKSVSSFVSATCLLVGVGQFAVNYEMTLTNYDVILPGKSELGWSFRMCAVASALMTVVTICHIVDICRKRCSGPELSIQSDDTIAIVPHDALSMEDG